MNKLSITLVTIFSFLFLGVLSAKAATITVCASGCDQTTIQAAIDAASTGDTISVSAGSYATRLVFDVGESGKTITITGVGNVILNPNAASNRLINMSALQAGTNITLNNLQFVPTGTLSYAVTYWDNTTVASLTMNNCSFTLASDIAYGFMHSAATSTAGREVTLNNVTFNNPTVSASNGIGNFIDFSRITINGGSYTISNTASVATLNIMQTLVNQATTTITGATIDGGWTTVFLRGTASTSVAFGKVNFTNNTINLNTALTSGDWLNLSGVVANIASSTEVNFTGNSGTVNGYAVLVQKGAQKVRVENNNIILNPAVAVASHIISLGTDPGSGGSITDGISVLKNVIKYTGTATNLHGIFIGEGVDAGEIAYNKLNVWSTLGLVLKGANNLNVHHNELIAYAGALYLKSDSDHNTLTHNTVYAIDRNAAGGTAYAFIYQKADTGGANLHPRWNTITDNIFICSGTAYCAYDDSDNDDAGVWEHGMNRIDRNIYYPLNGAKLANWNNVDYVSGTLATLQTNWNLRGKDANEPAGIGYVWPNNDANSVETNPQVISIANLDFRISASSPAKGTKNSASPLLSVWNDIGAWQTSTASLKPTRSMNFRTTVK